MARYIAPPRTGDPVVDFRGRNIEPGDVIIFAAQLGRSAVLDECVVVDIRWQNDLVTLAVDKIVNGDYVPPNTNGNRNGYYLKKKRRTHLHYPSRTVVSDEKAEDFWKRYGIGQE